MAIKPISAEAANRHEALYLRLTTMLRQTETGANKHPDAPIGPLVRRLAEDLLFEARRFIGGPKAIPPAAPDLVGLATQLGQALVALEVFENRHSGWDEAIKCFVWSLHEGKKLPIGRLKPRTVPQPEQQTAHVKMLRHKLGKLLDAKHEERYERGRRDGAIEAAQAMAKARDEEDAQTYPRVHGPG